MQYVLDRISTVQACDALLAGAQKKKQNLERRRRILGESMDAFRKRLDQVSREAAQVQSIREAFTAAYESLPEGKYKADMKIKVKRLELRQAMLEKKMCTCNVGALLVKELQYNHLDSQVLALENYITAVAQRRMVLDQTPLHVVQPEILSFKPLGAHFSMPPVAAVRLRPWTLSDELLVA
jgi:hypothetical protein